MKNTSSDKTFTAELVENGTKTGKRITCSVAGKYSMKSSITGDIFEIGKLWKDDAGDLFILERFSRHQTTFKRFERADFHIIEMLEN